MITYQLATVKDIDILVSLRIKDMELFHDTPFPKEYEIHIKNFYMSKMEQNSCFTILGYQQEKLVTMGTIYFYDVLPSNSNPLGSMGYMTNIWTHEQYRRQGLASEIVDQLLEIAKERHSPVSLQASEEGIALYLKKGFIKKDTMMIYSN